jgi:predicted TIM-barrel fold metal-dependent hydrolase
MVEIENHKGARPIASMFGRPRPDWLALHSEAAIDASLPIVDAHHHLWLHEGSRYMVDDFSDDLASGHKVVASVYVECGSMYRADGPEPLRPAGEVEFAAEVSFTQDQAGICKAIVGTADLSLGGRVKPVLQTEIEAGRGRLRGIRRITAWDADEELMTNLIRRRQGMLTEPSFREGFACLAPLGLSFDAFVFQRQLPELLDLARRFPDTRIVIDHCGGPIRVASYARTLDDSFIAWRNDLKALAACDNVWVKLGGLGMRISGFDFEFRERPPTSHQLAEAWRPYIETCIEAFGPSRSMFESNFPADKGTCSYAVLWNAFKRITEGYLDAEKEDLFSRTASRFYKLPNIHKMPDPAPQSSS